MYDTREYNLTHGRILWTSGHGTQGGIILFTLKTNFENFPRSETGLILFHWGLLF